MGKDKARVFTYDFKTGRKGYHWPDHRGPDKHVGAVLTPEGIVSYYCIPAHYLHLRFAVGGRCYIRQISGWSGTTQGLITRAAKVFAKSMVANLGGNP